ncbi:afadin [Pteropus vampyrus]|uniref:Afadin n=1 Tax=Pteropus vampyrus TaxID=132908 RepID=A0A6P6BQW4_PTEVA|nr:afadin [Pteropus vampyrus]
MRFYFQDKAAGNFATKCIRVSSTATTQDVIETLAEKFRPDMRMLSSPKYSLYEVHVSGERRLDTDEKPLVVQLNWNKDDREGRFVLKNENDAVAPKAQSNGPEKQEKEGVIQNFKRTLSKKEKKEKKKREKEATRQASDKDDRALQGDDIENCRLAAELYKDMPETSFTRTISNPEVVMKRRRQQKLERRMQEFRSSDGRPDSGGTLRIYADSLKPNIPYKTILLSTTDPADFAVAEALEKYGLEKENPKDYCIARVAVPRGITGSLFPGSSLSSGQSAGHSPPTSVWFTAYNVAVAGILVFQLKRRPPDYVPRKAKKHADGKPARGKERADGGGPALPPEKLPYLVELSPDGSDSRDKPKLYRLQLSVTEVGTEKLDDSSIQLFGSGIQPHHCDLTNMDGVVTVTPRSMDAETYVEGQRISETTMLQSGMNVRFGASHVFKFVDPSVDHALTKRPVDGGLTAKGPRHKPGVVQETAFEFGGDVHSGMALPTSKSTTRLDSDRVSSASGTAERGMVKPVSRVGQQPDYRRQESRSQDAAGPEPTLPASIEFRESSEDSFLSAIINYTNSSTVHFKLSPTYVLYMACRYVLSSQYRPDVSPTERTHKVIAIVNRMVSMMEAVIQKQKNIAGALAFWMANASELLNFIKQDRDLSRITLDAQDVLAHLVQMAFKYLVHCLQSELNNYMPAFLDDPDENSLQRPKIDAVLHTLTGAMCLLRRCRVNAALTIQLFSQLFHFINMWLFNRLVTGPESGLCSHYWGAIIRQQLGHVEAWAEKQGLELAADCHLSRIVQATTLLTMDKYAPDDIPNINSTCFKLNSLQLQALLRSYHCAPDEPFIPADLIENVVAVAENTADELARSDGRDVQLQEDPDLQLPFLLPEDGYSCDVVRNVPSGLQEFLDPLCQRGFCRLVPHARSPGTWTVYFEGADYESHLMRDSTELAQPLRKEPEIITVTLKKQNGMGLSIVAAKGAGQDKLGIYVKSVVKGGAADVDGRLAAGDQLLSVDGRSLVGLSQERAAELMTRTTSVVTLEVAKQGAIYHGLATLLSQPSPTMQRLSDRRGSAKPRPKSEGFELYNSSAQNGSPESPQPPWAEYSEPKKLPGDDRLTKNRADHRSSPNVATEQPQSPCTNTSGPRSPQNPAVASLSLRQTSLGLSWPPRCCPGLTPSFTATLGGGCRPPLRVTWLRSEGQPVLPPGDRCSRLQRPGLARWPAVGLTLCHGPGTAVGGVLPHSGVALRERALPKEDTVLPPAGSEAAAPDAAARSRNRRPVEAAGPAGTLRPGPRAFSVTACPGRCVSAKGGSWAACLPDSSGSSHQLPAESLMSPVVVYVVGFIGRRFSPSVLMALSTSVAGSGPLTRLQDEERQRQRQLEEMQRREAEDRARQDAARGQQQEEARAKRDAEEKVLVLPPVLVAPRQSHRGYSRFDATPRVEKERHAFPSGCLNVEREDESFFNGKGPNSYTGSTGTLFGAHDAYRDLREKPPKSHDADPPTSSGAPENLTFRERQRLFSQGHDVSNKVKASRKLMELENELNTK